MELNYADFLTDEQKAAIGETLKDKVIQIIEGVEVKKQSLDISDMIRSEIEDIFQNGDVYKYVDVKKIGNALTKKMFETIKQ